MPPSSPRYGVCSGRAGWAFERKYAANRPLRHPLCHDSLIRTLRSGTPGLAVAAAIALYACVTGLGASEASPQPSATSVHFGAQQAELRATPNIVVIMADDMRADDLRWMPSVRGLLVDRGAKFTNSFAPYPLCCPARASFLTGQYAHNHGVLSNRANFGFHAFDDTSTIGTDLHAAGYRTALIGKYLNRYGEDPPPGEPVGVSSERYVPPGWTNWQGAPTVKEGPFKGSVYNYRKSTLNRNGQLVSLSGKYNTHAFGDISVRIIERWAGSDTPFFLYASYLAPHFGLPAEPDDPDRIQVDRPRILARTAAVTDAVRGRFDGVITKPRGVAEADVSDKPTWFTQMPMATPRNRAAMVESARQRAESLVVLDRQVERTVTALRQAGELDQTVIVFTSDNGYFDGEHRIQYDKTLAYEPSLRVPLVIRGAGIPAGVLRHDPVMSIDLAPTINALAGATADRLVDGRSMLRIARNGDLGWTRAVLTATGPFISLETWVKNSIRLADSPFEDRPRFVLGLRTPRYAYFTWSTDEVELYDMRTDPQQLVSVDGNPEYADEEAELAAFLESVKTCAGVGCGAPLPPGLRGPSTGPPG